VAGDFNYYSLLGLAPTATLPEIKSAYRAAIAKYHPDVNPAPNAESLTKILNEAWSILQDPAKRAEYDATLTSNSTKAAKPKDDAPPPEMLYCERCGEEDVHLRFVIFYRVASTLFSTNVMTTQMRLCTKCRSHEAWSAALFTAFWGIWQFPWGLVYTIRALYVAIHGGYLEKKANAAMLTYLSHAYAGRGDNNAAATVLAACYRFKRSKDVVAALESFKKVGGSVSHAPSWLDGQSFAVASVFIPLIVLEIVFTVVHFQWQYFSHEYRTEVSRMMWEMRQALQQWPH